MAIDLTRITRLRQTAQRGADGEYDLDAIFNRELYPAINAIRQAVVDIVEGGGYTTIEDEGVAVAQERVLNFIGSLVTVTPGLLKTDVSIATPPPVPMVFTWSMPDLKNSLNAFVMDPSEDGSGAGGYAFATPDQEGRGQRVMMIPGTFYEMTARIRGVQPGATDIIWTYTMRVNEADTLTSDSFNVRTTGPHQKVTTISQHVDKNDRVTFKSQTDVALATVSVPWIGTLFMPD